MEIQYIIPDNIQGLSIYVFGSILHNSNGNDVDILFVYDDKIFEPRCIYDIIKPIQLKIGNYFQKYVHLMVLSKNEAYKSNVFSRFECIELKKVIFGKGKNG
jgi:predicted nucleotidyltransferase